MPTLRVLFLGMNNDTSATLLRALLDAGAVDVCGVLVAAAHRAGGPPIARVAPTQARSPLPIANPFLERTLAQIAWERDLPVFELRRPGAAETLALVAELQPDVACVACFAQRIPPSLLALPRLGFLNLHPALLPAHRGPAPLFWVFRDGEQVAGVTIHFMDAGLDTGDIAAQESFALPDGIAGGMVAQHCDALGARLMLQVLQKLPDGMLSRRPQPPGGSYQPWPTRDDWRIATSWTARRTFNFMRGTAEWGQPYIVQRGGEELALATAIAYEPHELLPEAFVRVGGEVLIQFADGILRARAI
ncbi:MAG: formyltransferase family protein [Roseiflexaceae bacterium]